MNAPSLLWDLRFGGFDEEEIREIGIEIRKVWIQRRSQIRSTENE